MSRKISELRINYDKGRLARRELADDPFVQFGRWFAAAREADILEPNAMTLATSTPTGVPSARVVLLKGVDKGFRFFTNYDSDKGEEMLANPHAALVFLWDVLHRQVRVTGWVEKLSRGESADYYHSRPRSSQIGAHVSPQSQIIPNRAFLDKLQAETEAKYEDVETIPLPDNWGGYILKPRTVEFWQGRESRLHDRFRYTRAGDEWRIERLAP